VIPYHLVSAGRCHASLLDGEPVELQPGELIIFPHGDRHVLASVSPGKLKPIEIRGEDLYSLVRPGEVAPLTKGADGEPTRIICGYLACDRRLSEPILAGLPRLLHVGLKDSGIASWVESSVRFSVAEST